MGEGEREREPEGTEEMICCSGFREGDGGGLVTGTLRWRSEGMEVEGKGRYCIVD